MFQMIFGFEDGTLGGENAIPYSRNIEFSLQSKKTRCSSSRLSIFEVERISEEKSVLILETFNSSSKKLYQETLPRTPMASRLSIFEVGRISEEKGVLILETFNSSSTKLYQETRWPADVLFPRVGGSW